MAPITKKMKEGAEPMRSFGDLLQFFDDDVKPGDVKSSDAKPGGGRKKDGKK